MGYGQPTGWITQLCWWNQAWTCRQRWSPQWSQELSKGQLWERAFEDAKERRRENRKLRPGSFARLRRRCSVSRSEPVVKLFKVSGFCLRTALVVLGLEMLSPGPVGAQLLLPAEEVSFDVLADIPTSFAHVTFAGIPRGYSVSNTIYAAWCLEFDKPIHEGQTYYAKLYDSQANTLPSHLSDLPWDKLDYILNHKEGVWLDVQNAIWATLGQPVTQPYNEAANTLSNKAAVFGPGFKPIHGQTCSVIIDHADPMNQRLLMEIPCVCPCTNTNVPFDFGVAIVSYTPGGPFVGRIYGEPDQCYVVEASGDMRDWVEIFAGRTTAEFMEFRDPNPTGERRFYRAKVRQEF